MWFWRSAEALRGFGFAERIAVSSANVARTVLSVIGIYYDMSTVKWEIYQ
jgi:hypothetical protein